MIFHCVCIIKETYEGKPWGVGGGATIIFTNVLKVPYEGRSISLAAGLSGQNDLPPMLLSWTLMGINIYQRFPWKKPSFPGTAKFTD